MTARRSRSRWIGLFLAAVALPAQAVTLRIPPGDLIRALEDLGRQSGAEIIYEAKLLRGLRTKGVNRDISPEDAVRKLIQGTPLVVHIDASGAMLVTRRGDPPPTRVAATDKAASTSQDTDAAGRRVR